MVNSGAFKTNYNEHPHDDREFSEKPLHVLVSVYREKTVFRISGKM